MFAKICAGKPYVHEGFPSLEEMQVAVGGWITSALCIPSPSRSNVSVDVMVNDEGLLLNLPIHFLRTTDLAYIAGDIIISASNAEGETIPATEAELITAFRYLFPLAAPLTDYSDQL
jgi:hypothetical protein